MACLPPKKAPARRDEPPEYGLKSGAFRPGRRWAVDNVGPGGYADKLDPKARAWLEQFNREYYDADNRSLKSVGALHWSKALRRDCYARQNASHRDVYARGLVELEEDGEVSGLDSQAKHVRDRDASHRLAARIIREKNPPARSW